LLASGYTRICYKGQTRSGQTKTFQHHLPWNYNETVKFIDENSASTNGIAQTTIITKQQPKKGEKPGVNLQKHFC
jgi:hypothetical protein